MSKHSRSESWGEGVEKVRSLSAVLVQGKMSSLFINDLNAGAGGMGAATQYTVNNQMVNATLMNIADTPTNVQLPGVYKVSPRRKCRAPTAWSRASKLTHDSKWPYSGIAVRSVAVWCRTRRSLEYPLCARVTTFPHCTPPSFVMVAWRSSTGRPPVRIASEWQWASSRCSPASAEETPPVLRFLEDGGKVISSGPGTLGVNALR